MLQTSTAILVDPIQIGRHKVGLMNLEKEDILEKQTWRKEQLQIEINQMKKNLKQQRILQKVKKQ